MEHSSSVHYGSFVFVLHSHLPYVITHGRWPHGSDWLNEAAAETYIPLLNVLHELQQENAHPRLTIGITPVLTEQLADETFVEEFDQYLKTKIKAARQDKDEFTRTGQSHLASIAAYWEAWFKEIRTAFLDKYHANIPGAFRKLQDKGVVDIITCGATHGYFPLLGLDTSIQAQVKVAVETHTRHYKRPPRGIWLPECGYRPAYRWKPPVDSDPAIAEYDRKGIEEFLSENGIEYFIVDSALLKGGKPVGVYLDRFQALRKAWDQFDENAQRYNEDFTKTPYELYLTGSGVKTEKQPVAIFTRDPKTAVQVWSGEHGYPGDGWYLDFHKKRFPGGHRYWRVTQVKADMADKREYEPEKTVSRVEENASHFVDLIAATLKEHYEQTGCPGLITAPYDTELFGHWWFEGPQFLKKVLQKLNERSDVNAATASEKLDELKPARVVHLPEGSWGEGGHHYIWLNKDTEWTWKHIYPAEIRMRELAQKYGNTPNRKLRKILEQAARELLLLQSSDWQFLISTVAAKDYAELRFANHHSDFQRLARMAEDYVTFSKLPEEDWTYLRETQERDSLFQSIDLQWWSELEFP